MTNLHPNNISARQLIVIASLLIGTMLCGAARAASNVVAHASDDMLWVGQVYSAPEVKPSGERTNLRYRSLNAADQSWKQLPALAGRVVQIANRGQSAAVLLASGDWLLLWPDGSSTGPALPGDAKLMAIASDRDTLYAVGGPQQHPATNPTTAPTTQPLIDPAKSAIYLLQNGSWTPLVNCPDSLAPLPGEISLAMVDRTVMLAEPDAAGAIHVYQLGADQKLLDRGAIHPPANPSTFKLLSGTQRPTLWLAAAASAGYLYIGGDKWGDPLKFDLSKPLAVNGATVVPAAGNIRLFLSDDKAKLYEQRYDLAGKRIGDLTAQETPQPSSPDAYDNWPTLALLAGLGFLMLTTTRKRATETDRDNPEAPVLAAPSQRFLAGIIDASPVILTALYFAETRTQPYDMGDLTWTIPVIVSLAIYLLHTFFSELFTGRTLGKLVVGLKVTMTDGKPAKAGAIVVRNLLRVVDLFPLLPMCVVILFSPMKQRIGDLLAGTIVISLPRPDEEGEEKERDEE